MVEYGSEVARADPPSAASRSIGMRIRLNGKPHDVSDGMTVARLLEELRIRPERVAVLVNAGIVKKTLYASATLQEGDAVEVLTVMAGGTEVIG